MRERLAELVESLPEAETRSVPLDPETLEQLRSLGYIR